MVDTRGGFWLETELEVSYNFKAALGVKNLPANIGDMEMWVWSLGPEDSLGEGMATVSSILAWRMPWTEGHKESNTAEATWRACKNKKFSELMKEI